MKVPKSEECVRILFITTLSILAVGAKPKCDPVDNVYYHQQADKCFPCDRCYKGEEPISLEIWDFNWDSETGPTECRRCRKCQQGMFSDTRSYACKPCKNCTLYNQYETFQCTNEHDAICDGVKPTTPYRPIINSTPDPKSESNHDKNNSGFSSVYIAGMICATIFGVFIFLICFFCVKQRLYMTCKRKENGSRQEVQMPTEKELSGQITINIPTQEGSDDSQPLLQQISCNSQSVADSNIELEEMGLLDVHSILTKNSQELNICIDGIPYSDDQSPATGNLVRYKNHEFGNSEALTTDCSTDSETDQGAMGLNRVTDGATNTFSRKIKFDRQWSYPFDEKGERDFNSTASKPDILPVTEQVSKDDLSIGAKNRKENQVLEEKFLHNASKHLVKNRLYIDVARECGLEEADIEIVKYDFQQESVQEISYQMLLKLVKKQGITHAVFIKALQKHDQMALEKILQHH